jgi:hypothetical protein
LDSFTPRTFRRRQIIKVEVSPYELYGLIEALESPLAADNPETIDVADHWFDRVAELREAYR